VPVATSLAKLAVTRAPRSPLRVLVVEDDPLFRRFVLAALQEARLLSVDAVPVGSLAEARMALSGGRFDCVLLDLGLPDGQGVQTVKTTMESGPGVPIVVLTGQEGGMVADRMLQEGAQDYLEKAHLEPGSLERALRHAVDRGRWTAEMAEANRQLQQRNADLDDFAHAVSHDLKAPLRALYHLARDAREHLEEGDLDKAREELDAMPPRIARLFAMIEGILALSEAGRRREEAEEIEVARFVREIVESLRLPSGFHVAVSTAAKVRTSRALLSQVLQNLIDNAAKHHDGTTGRIEVACQDLGRWLEFTVLDDGPGIPENQRERAFQLFQTLNGRKDSSGVGLALVRKVVLAHGGDIRVEAAQPRGACFRFTWPKA
jgi:signal transduction histidine kinase